jgi:ribosomal protein S18 acetylase RimI-like enzyme
LSIANRPRGCTWNYGASYRICLEIDEDLGVKTACQSRQAPKTVPPQAAAEQAGRGQFTWPVPSKVIFCDLLRPTKLSRPFALMPQTVIHNLTPADAADFRAIRLAALMHAPDAFGSTYEAEADRPMSAWAERLAAPGAFGAYVDGRLVGMARFVQDAGSDKERHKGSVYGMYVAPQAWGQGIGSALLEALLAHAAGVVEQIRLGVVATNASAIRLYERHGFEIYGKEMHSLKTAAGYADEVLMVRFLR